MEMGNPNSRDCARAIELLQEGEDLLLLAKPRTAIPMAEMVLALIPGLVAGGMLCYIICLSPALVWLVLLVTWPIWGIGAVSLSTPWLYRRNRERTLYLLTNQRVLVVQPMLFGERVVDYPLHAYLVKSVQVKKDGCGDIVFAYERRWQPEFGICYGTCPVGFLAVPQVERVAQMIEAQVPFDAAAAPNALVGLLKPMPVLMSVLIGAGMVLCLLCFVVMGWQLFCEVRAEGGSLLDLIFPMLFMLAAGGMALMLCISMLKSGRKQNAKSDEY